jgi:hypothetical protein
MGQDGMPNGNETSHPAQREIDDETFSALILLTNLRVDGKTLADLPDSEAERLIRLLGREEIEDILSVEDDVFPGPEADLASG